MRQAVIALIFGLCVLTTACRAAGEPESGRVESVRSEYDHDDQSVLLRGEIVVVLVGRDFSDESKAAEELSSWNLFIDDQQVATSPTVRFGLAKNTKQSAGTKSAELHFNLAPVDANRAAWRRVYRKVPVVGKINLPITVGPKAGSPAAPVVASVLVTTPKQFWLAAGGWILLVLVVVLAAWHWGLLSDPQAEKRPDDTYPISLGRTQAAWWFLIVLGSWCFIGLVTGTWFGTMSSQAIGLMGLAAATAVAAVAIDESARQRAAGANAGGSAAGAQPGQTAGAAGAGQPNQAAAAAPGAQPNQAAVAVAGAQQNQAVAVAVAGQPNQAGAGAGGGAAPQPQPDRHQRTAPKKWLDDLILEDRGYALHRLQNVVWTAVLGGVFVRSVLIDLTMPEFDANQLLLMGISAGTYLGVKNSVGR
jgi:hypothetical protein